MFPRFLQLFILAALILLLPTLLYMSHDPRGATIIDAKTGLSYSADSILNKTNLNPLAQTSQGHGVDGSNTKGHLWDDLLKKPVEKVGSTWTNLVDMLKNAKNGDGTKSNSKQTQTKPTTEEYVEGVMMPKMGNPEAKAALGRSTWHFLHTMTLRFPDKPTKEQSATLKTFFQVFAQLYPCGDCARHFQQLLKELPPQTGSRMNAALWLCSVHNKVNQRLGKPEFPCDKLDESYDCGCGPDPTASTTATTAAAISTTATGDTADSLTKFKLIKRTTPSHSKPEQIQPELRWLVKRALLSSSQESIENRLASQTILDSTESCLCRIRRR